VAHESGEEGRCFGGDKKMHVIRENDEQVDVYAEERQSPADYTEDENIE
jgi:hypothetical protein